MSESFKTILFIAFCTAAAVQLFYYLWFYLAPAIYKPAKKVAATPPVSVIICARNEAANLERFLPAVLEQDYPSFEVIVVNDCSEDDSFDVLGGLLAKYSTLRVSSVSKDPKFTHNKKLAQFIGIKAALYDILLFTDADCMPESDKWLAGMVSNYSKGIEFVLGYGGYLRTKGLLNRYLRYDCMFIASQYLGMAIRGIPYMGVGRNLSYLKAVFFRNRGFGIHNHLQSGDDDLFVNTNASSKNTAVEFSTGTHTRSVPAATPAEFVKQKQRHFTTARYYRVRDKILLFAEPLSRVVFYILLVILSTSLYRWPFLASVFGVRLFVQVSFTVAAGRKLNERGLLPYSIIFDIFSPLINIVLYLTSIKNRTGRVTWK